MFDDVEMTNPLWKNGVIVKSEAYFDKKNLDLSLRKMVVVTILIFHHQN